jgi:hypothetical protein
VEGQGRELGRDYRGPAQLANAPANACPGLDPGREPVRRQEHAPLKDSGAPFEGHVHIGAQI